MKIEQNSCVIVKCNFRGIDDLCKLGKEYLICNGMQIKHFIGKILKLLTYYTLF